MTERLWGVPSSWEWTVVNSLGQVVSGGTPSTKRREYWGGEIIWIAPSDLSGYKPKFITQGAKTLTDEGLANSSAKVIPAGSVMFSSRAPVGYVAINSVPAATNQGFKSVVPCSGIFNEYLYHYLKASKQWAERRATGTTFKELSGSAFGMLPVPVPPINEQHRIVEKIEVLFDEIDAGVSSLQKARITLGLYRQSLLKSAFEGRLTADWRACNPYKLEAPETLLARIQTEREARYKAALDDWQDALAKWRANGEQGKKPAKPKRQSDFSFHPAPASSPWPTVQVKAVLRSPLINGRSVKDKTGGFPVLRLTSLKNGKIILAERKQGNWSENEARPFLVEQDDIFLARGNGSKKLVGIGGRVHEDPLPIAFPDTMIRVRLDPSAIRADFFLRVWNSWSVRSQIEEAARTTAGIYKINQDHVSGFVLPLPSIAEQAEIVRILDARLDAADKLEAEIDAALARAEALRQSILKKAFSGQLVPQNPADESASALLARIKAERKLAPKPKRRRKTVA